MRTPWEKMSLKPAKSYLCVQNVNTVKLNK